MLKEIWYGWTESKGNVAGGGWKGKQGPELLALAGLSGEFGFYC